MGHNQSWGIISHGEHIMWGLKIVADSEANCDNKAKAEIFNINLCYSCIKKFFVVLRHTVSNTNSSEAPNMIIFCNKITSFLFL